VPDFIGRRQAALSLALISKTRRDRVFLLLIGQLALS